MVTPTILLKVHVAAQRLLNLLTARAVCDLNVKPSLINKANRRVYSYVHVTRGGAALVALHACLKRDGELRRSHVVGSTRGGGHGLAHAWKVVIAIVGIVASKAILLLASCTFVEGLGLVGLIAGWHVTWNVMSTPAILTRCLLHRL
jgi:hypothetical protein